jgi:hypothetical protein
MGHGYEAWAMGGGMEDLVWPWAAFNQAGGA